MEIKYTNSKKSGFTLIELLVVISIIALLAALVMLALSNARAKGRDTKRVADMNQMLKAFELYFNDKYSYPTLTTSPGASLSAISPLLIPNYLSTMPVTLSPADGICSSALGVNGSNDYYMYQNVAGGQMVTNTYVITFCLGGTVGSLNPGPHTLTQSGFQ